MPSPLRSPKNSSKTNTSPKHPPYHQLVVSACLDLNDGKRCKPVSAYAIRKWLEDNYDVDIHSKMTCTCIKKALHCAVDEGQLYPVKLSFSLTPKAKRDGGHSPKKSNSPTSKGTESPRTPHKKSPENSEKSTNKRKVPATPRKSSTISKRRKSKGSLTSSIVQTLQPTRLFCGPVLTDFDQGFWSNESQDGNFGGRNLENWSRATVSQHEEMYECCTRESGSKNSLMFSEKKQWVDWSKFRKWLTCTDLEHWWKLRKVGTNKIEKSHWYFSFPSCGWSLCACIRFPTK